MNANNTTCERITSAYYELTGSEKKIADHVLKNSAEVQFMSITELARAAGVSEASISRFCRSLNFSGFNAFKLELAKDAATAVSVSPTDGTSIEDTLMLSCQRAIQRTRELLVSDDMAAAIELLCEARKVCCMGQGGSLIVAQEAWSLFSTVSSRFICVQDSHLQSMTAALMDERDAVLYFSYSGATRAALDVLPMVKANGVKVILVTRYKLSPASGYADVSLICGADESPMQFGSVEARVSQLYLINVLFHGLCERNARQTAHNRDKILRSLNVKHV